MPCLSLPFVCLWVKRNGDSLILAVDTLLFFSNVKKIQGKCRVLHRGLWRYKSTHGENGKRNMRMGWGREIPLQTILTTALSGAEETSIGRQGEPLECAEFSGEILAWICKSLFSNRVHSEPKNQPRGTYNETLASTSPHILANWFISRRSWLNPYIFSHIFMNLSKLCNHPFASIELACGGLMLHMN